MPEYPSYLIHHGIKGQHWGERQYQNPDGTYTELGKERRRIGSKNKNGEYIIPKGSKVYRVTSYKKEPTEGPKYVYTDADKKVYEGAFSTFIKKYASQTQSLYKIEGPETKVYRKTYITKRDLKAPSKEVADAIIEMRVKTSPIVYSKVKQMGAYMIQNDHPFVRNLIKEMRKEIEENGQTSDETNKKMSIAAYNLMLEHDKYEFNQFINKVAKMKYNAVLDYNNVNGYNDAKEPIIVINSKKTLKDIKTEELEDKYIEETMKELEKEIGRKAVL